MSFNNAINSHFKGSTVGAPCSTKVTLTNSQIKNLATTPIQILPAAGSGKVYVVIGGLCKSIYGGNNPFTGGGIVEVQNASGIGQLRWGQLSLQQSNSCYLPANENQATTFANVAATSVENSALNLKNIGSNFAGNAANDNTAEYMIQYFVVSI